MELKTRWEDVEAHVMERSVTDEDFRRRLLADPRATLQTELSACSVTARIPDYLDVRVIEDTQTTLHIVLPPRPDHEIEQEIWAVKKKKPKNTRRSCTCSSRCCA